MPPTTPITFRCPNSVVEAIDRIGRDRYPRTEGEGGVAKIDYDRTAAILDIINAGIAAIDEGFAPKQIERGVADKQSLDDVKQLIRQELERLLPELLEKHVGSAGKVALADTPLTVEASAEERLIEIERERSELRQPIDMLKTQLALTNESSPGVELPDAPTLLNQYKAIHPKTKVTLTDLKAILSLLPQNFQKLEE